MLSQNLLGYNLQEDGLYSVINPKVGGPGPPPTKLFIGGCGNEITPKQLKSLREACVYADVIDTNACIKNINTCGMSAEELFNTYSIYNPQKGLYKSWGDIEFPWEINELTPNLVFSETNNKWKETQYKALIAYTIGTRIVYIEDDGYTISVYEALEDISTFPLALDKNKWERICSIKTTIPLGLPTISQLISLYPFYEPELFYKNWGDVKFNWESIPEENFSDIWKEARDRKADLFSQGDMFLVEGECGDTVCLYIVKEDILATEENYLKYKVFSHYGPWEKIYCVSTSVNKCLEPQRTKTPEEGYKLIPIGSKEHFVEVPVPYKLKPPEKELKSEVLKPQPKVLSQLEIDVLDGTLPPNCLKR